MKILSDYFGKTLQFIQPSIWKRTFELRDSGQVVGTLEYSRFFSVKAEANLFGTKWEFYEPKWWKQLIEIREMGKELPIAIYKPPAFKKQGKLELPHGESVLLYSNFFGTTYEIRDKYESRLVLFKSKFGFRTKIEIQIEKRSEVLEKYPWILLLIIYIEINKSRRRSSG
jgi:hypothetical protein